MMALSIGTQITSGPGGRLLTNCNVWSPDGQWIVYDTRTNADGSVFDGDRIEIVNVATGVVRCLYESKNGAYCGVATFDPIRNRVVFILGPENPTPGWTYGPAHRQGVLVEIDKPGIAVNLDARDLSPPRTPGALRGGSHVHLFSSDGAWVGCTYNDALLERFAGESEDNDTDQRNIGVSVPTASGVTVPPDNDRNHDGSYFTVLVTRTTARPRPGSDEISQAVEQGWIGANGYMRPDDSHQRRAVAFQGTALMPDGRAIAEVYVADIPDDVTIPSADGPLEGTPTRRPQPPLGTTQRRLTYTANRKFPGIQGPRHWLNSSANGTQIAFLMRDDAGVVQIWTVSPNGGAPHQITTESWNVASAFTWSRDCQTITYVADNSIFVVDAKTGRSRRVTERGDDQNAPLALACVFSPDGRRIAYQRRVLDAKSGALCNQIFVVDV